MVPAISLLSVGLSSAAPEGLTQRAPIYIDGNDSFTPANGVVAGSGTAEDPYIIENWDIDAENADGIRILDTDAHFIIRNCYVHDGKEDNNLGISFLNVKNGEINSVLAENNFEGINFFKSSNNIILNSNVLNNAHDGIRLNYSFNNNIENCIAENNSYGIYFWSSSNNKIEFSVAKSNLWGGIRLDFLSDNNLVMWCSAENNYGGFSITNSSNDNISKCIAKNNLFGISLSLSLNNMITNNTVWNSRFGIRLYNSYSNLIHYNDFINNDTGIRLHYYVDNNLIHHNNLVNNANQAYDDGKNYWDDGYPSGGNYWSDYAGEDADNDGIGDMPYGVYGDNNQDRYPLMRPFVPAFVPVTKPSPVKWPLIAGVVGAVVITSVATAFYIRKTRLKKVKKRRRRKRRRRPRK